MSLFGRLFAASSPAPSKTPVPLVSRAAGAFSSVRYNRGATAALSAMEAASVVFGIVDRLATSVSLVDWKLYKSSKSGKPEDREEVTSHLALDILNKPNDFYSRQELMEAAQQHQELTGESWLVVSRNPRARTIPLELWPVRPDRMEPIPSPDAFLSGYEYRSPDGESVPLQKDDVLFVRRPDPSNPLRGLGPIRSVLTDIDSIRYSMEWNKNFFMNSAEPGGIVEIDRRLSDDEFEELVARWKEQHQGVAQAHRVAILEQVKWVDRKYTMRDMQFTELRGVTEEGIKLAFGFPKFALGQVDDVNRAQGEASIAMYAKWLIVPRLERWKGVFNRRFLPMFGSTASGLEFDYVSPVSEDSESENAARTSRVDAVAKLVPLGFKAPEALKAFDLPDIPWEKPEPPAPPAGAFPGDEFGDFDGPPPSDEVMAHAMRQIFGHKPGGIDHDQSKHGRRKYNDDKLIAERLGRLRGDLPADDTEIYRNQLRQARVTLARDRASVLAELEEVAFINEGLDDRDALRRRIDFAKARAGLDNDPRLKPLFTALESGNRGRILKALASVAASSGLTRIGGNPEDGPDQLIGFDPAEHTNMMPGMPRRGQKVLLVRPGYRAEIDGDTVLLEPAIVAVAELEDIRRIAGARASLYNQAPTDDPDLARVQAQWEQALEQLLAEWRTISAAQRAEITRQVEAAIEDEDIEGLSDLDVSTETATAVLLAALLAMYGVAATQMAAEMTALGVPVTAAAASVEVIAPIAATVASLLAAGLVQVAAQAALRAWRPGVKAAQVVAGVVKALGGLSDRALRDQLGGALSRAQNMGRLETARDYEESLAPGQVSQVIYFSKETLDRNTCWACNNIDGTEYASWIEAWVDYAGGIYRGCEGGLRCRGTIKAKWNPEAGR